MLPNARQAERLSGRPHLGPAPKPIADPSPRARNIGMYLQLVTRQGPVAEG